MIFFFCLIKAKISINAVKKKDLEKIFICLVTNSLLLIPSVSFAKIILNEQFISNPVSSSIWHIPTWESSTDGTFVGRTQFRCSQNSPLPPTIDGNAIIQVDTYNPTALPGSPSFYGTDLITNQSFSLGNGIHIKVRAKMVTTMPGIVGGIFLYALKDGSNTIHDEIDFELLTNIPSQVQTNIYSNEPLGGGHPQFTSFAFGSITDYHVYEIQWLPNQVTWIIDGQTVRVETTRIPAGPMGFHLNIWVPDSTWKDAYNPELQPVTSPIENKAYWMSVDWVTIETIEPAIAPVPKKCNILPALFLLLPD